MRRREARAAALAALFVAAILAACAPPASAPSSSGPPAREPGSSAPGSSAPASSVPASSVAASSVPASSAPASSVGTSPGVGRSTSGAVVAAPLPSPGAPARPSSSPGEAAAPDALAEQLLRGGGAALRGVLAAPETHRFQVLYGVVTEGASPTLERHGYRADAEYFFPASSMKLPIALAMVERLAGLRASAHPGWSRDTTMRIFPVSGAAEPFVTTLARETWRALIVSDNASANRLLGAVGHREANETLWSLGLASARVRAGFATGAEVDPAALSPRIELALEGGAIDAVAARRSDLVPPPTDAPGLAVGKATLVDGRRVDAPLSFADKNAIFLRDLQDALVRVMRPELLPRSPAAAADGDDVAYLRHTLGTLPSASGLAGFDRNVVADYQLVPYLRGIERVKKRGHFEIYSKVGQAYGFLIANAYVVDKDTGRAFFLTASVYANPDETMNSDTYAYAAVSFPALADVAEVFCRHALGR